MHTKDLLPKVDLRTVNSRTKDSFKYSVCLTRPWGWLDDAIAWSKTELINEWRWYIERASTDQLPGIYIFYFDTDRDYFAFTMKFQ
jgi:hypothetical protein